ncbi:hypothetical protein LINPERPRIM_LOCUS30845 [Linum perenne]
MASTTGHLRTGKISISSSEQRWPLVVTRYSREMQLAK